MEFNHINDCWDYLREAKDYNDLYNRTLDLPRWSGEWDITRNEYENAKAELQKRLTRVENLPKVEEEGWEDPQLLEITIEQKLL